TDAATDTLTRTAVHSSSNGGAAVDWTGKTVEISAVLPARRLATDHAGLVENLTITTSRAGNAETIAIKTLAGTDPSPTDPVRIAFNTTTGGFEVLELTAALSVTFSSGSTGGAVANLAFKVGVLLFNNAGTLAMGAVVRPSGIRDNSVVSTTAEGGAGGADSPRVIYSAAALSNVRCRVLGYVTYTLATPGTWDTAPSEILLTRAAAVEIHARELLYEKTLTANGVFDTDEWWPGGTLPNNYDSFEIEAQLRSTVSASDDKGAFLLNGDAVNGNYRYARHYGGSSVSGSASDTPEAFGIVGSTALSNVFAMVFSRCLSPGSPSKEKMFITESFERRDSSTIYLFGYGTHWESTAAITRIQVVTDNNPTDQFVSGSSLKLYGLKTMTVLS
ncbi:hypothetical protein, partial [Candidatus Macondimonas diazotrophica]|uniref:hypothetical protein n=1 Tax=Candidatus Macondimonas diazotrophica TaxID=2305248 RepID=UPI00143267A0